MLCQGMTSILYFILTITRPTRISKKNATLMDHINTNSFIDSRLTTRILKVNVWDHFNCFLFVVVVVVVVAVVVFNESSQTHSRKKDNFVTRHILSSKNIKKFKKILREVDWTKITTLYNAKHAKNRLLQIYTRLSDIAFPKRR